MSGDTLKRLLTVLVLFIVAHSAQANVARVQFKPGTANATSGSVTLDSSSSDHDLMLVGCSSNNNSVPDFVWDNKGNFYSIIDFFASTAWYVAKDIHGGASHIISCSQFNQVYNIIAVEYSGADLYNPIGAKNKKGSYGSNPAVTGNITTGSFGMLVSYSFQFSAADATFTPTTSGGSVSLTGFSNSNGNGQSSDMADVAFTSVQTNIGVSWTATTGNNITSFIVEIKAAGTAPPILFAQGTSGVNALTTALNLSLTGTVAGNFLLAMCQNKLGALTISSSSNTWTVIATNSQFNATVVWAYAKNITGGSDTVSCGGLSTEFAMTVGEWSGIDKTSPLDVQASSGITAGGSSPGNITTTNATDLVVTGTTTYSNGVTNNWRVPTNFFGAVAGGTNGATVSGSTGGVAFAYQYLTTTTTITGGTTTSNLKSQANQSPTAMIAAFKQNPIPQAVGGPTPFVP